MPIERRVNLYRAIEARRGRPLVVYVTSTRPRYQIEIASDVIPELAVQLDQIGTTDAIDLLLISDGGCMATAFQVVAIIRERVKRFSVLAPSVAASAATVVACGAESLVMGPSGFLSPVDAQFRGRQLSESLSSMFGAEDVEAFIKFTRQQGTQVASNAITELVGQVGTVPLGSAARASKHLPREIEKLLRQHMRGIGAHWKSRRIARKLIGGFLTHGSRISRAEAVEIGLPVERRDPELERLIGAVADDFADFFQLRTPWNAASLVHENEACAALFKPIEVLNVPTYGPREEAPPTPYRLVQAVVESSRHASQKVEEGFIFASRKSECSVGTAITQTKSGWVSVEVPPP